MKEKVEIRINWDKDENTVNLHSNVNVYRKIMVHRTYIVPFELVSRFDMGT